MLDAHIVLGWKQILATTYYLLFFTISGVCFGLRLIPDRKDKRWIVTILCLDLIVFLGVCFPFMNLMWKVTLVFLMFLAGVTMGLFGAKGPSPLGNWLADWFEHMRQSRR